MKKTTVLPLFVSLLAAGSALPGEGAACAKVNAIINPGNQTVAESSTVNGTHVPTIVTLDGTNSNPKGSVSCSWSSLDTPPIPLTNQNSCQASFAAPDVGPSGKTLNFRLTVTTTENGCTGTDTNDTKVSVTNVVNSAPVASATFAGLSRPFSVNEGTVVTLDGSKSSDPDGDALTYNWKQLIDANSPTTAVTINNPQGAYATFTAPPEKYPNGETLTFRLTVSDGFLASSTDISLAVLSVNQAPAAAITCPGPVREGDSVTLASDHSSDPDGGPLTYQWSQVLGVPNADLSRTDLLGAQITFTAPSLTSYPNDTMTFGLKVTDNGNLSDSDQCKVQILDVTPPVIGGMTDLVKEATSTEGAGATYAPTAHDAYYGDVEVTCAPSSGTTFPLDAVTTVTCSASDKATPPNTAQASFAVKVQDTTPPALTLPNDMGPIEGNTLGGATITYLASALDLVDGSVAATCTPASGGLFPVGTSKVDCSATDAHNNTGKGSFQVTVQDTTPPALTLPNDMGPVEGNTLGGATISYLASALDLVDGSVAVTCTPASGGVFPVGTSKVDCSATDAHNNPGKGSFQVTVQDTTPPALTLPTDMGPVEGNTLGGAKITYLASALDLVDGSVAVNCNPASGTVFAVGTSKVDCSATDAHNNPGKGSFLVTVQDKTPPALTLPSDMGPVEGNTLGGATITYLASALDLVDGSIAVSCTPASGGIFRVGTTTVTCSATDAHNNPGTGSFKVTVQDKTPPALTLPTDIGPVEGNALGGAKITYSTSALDLVDGPVAVNCVPASGTVFPVGTTTVNCGATDTHSNQENSGFHVTVQDTTRPVIGDAISVTTFADAPTGAKVSYLPPMAADIVDGVFPATCLPASGTTFALGATTVTCSATDKHGNAADNKTFVINVNYGFGGLLPPYASGRSYKIKSAIPIKWQYTTKAGTVLPSANAAPTVEIHFILDTGMDDPNAIALNDSGNSGYQYDATTNTWQFNWKTSGMKAGTYDIYVKSGLTGQQEGPFRVQLAN